MPKIDKEHKTVDLSFYVEPGQRVYVRRINFKGNTRTEGEVMRREMRQFEGAWYSQAAIDRSKIRLQRLGYFKSVKIDTAKVAGTEAGITEPKTVFSACFGAPFLPLNPKWRWLQHL